MDKYTKGRNVEEPLEKHKIPIKDLPNDFLWMQVNPGTKMRNVLELAMKEMKTRDTVVWSGSGPAVGKVISCVEIMKRQYHNLHQVNKICFRKVKEFWDPLLEDLDPLVVTRDLPTIHVMLSKSQVNMTQPGYQAPYNSGNGHRKNLAKQENKSQRKRVDAAKFESFGLRSSRTKNTKRKPNKYHTKPKRYDESVERLSLGPTSERSEENNQGKESSITLVSSSDPGPSGVG